MKASEGSPGPGERDTPRHKAGCVRLTPSSPCPPSPCLSRLLPGLALHASWNHLQLPPAVSLVPSLLDPQQMKPFLAPTWACGPGTVSKAARKQTLQEQSGGPRANGWAPYRPHGAGNLREGDTHVTTKPFKTVRPLQQRAAANTARRTLALSLPCWDKI